MALLDFVIPLLPPSVNHYVKHKRDGTHYKTPAALAFLDAVPICARQVKLKLPYYAVEIWLMLGPGARLDLDNCAKVVIDGMVKGGQIHSDACVTSLVLHKKRGPRSQVSVTVWEGKEP